MRVQLWEPNLPSAEEIVDLRPEDNIKLSLRVREKIDRRIHHKSSSPK